MVAVVLVVVVVVVSVFDEGAPCLAHCQGCPCLMARIIHSLSPPGALMLG